MTAEEDAPGNPNPKTTIQALHFYRSLACIGLSPAAAPFKEHRRSIIRAAYASMARSAGPRRAWSRALLCRLRPRGHLGPPARPVSSTNRVDALRRLVPGSEAMDFCTLLEETADHVTRLATQVELMQAVLDAVEADKPYHPATQSN